MDPNAAGGSGVEAAAPAPSGGQQALPMGEAGTSQGEQQAGGQQPQAVTLEALASQLSNFEKEFGRVRKLQSQLDSLPKTIGGHFERFASDFQRQNQLSQLSPEQLQSIQQQQYQDNAFKQNIYSMIQEAMPQMFPEMMEVFEWAKDLRDGYSFYSGLKENVGDEAKYAELEPFFIEMLNENKQQWQSEETRQQAEEWKKNALSQPASVVLKALNKLAEKNKAGAAQVTNKRAEAGKKASFVPQGSKPPVPMSLEGMSEKEMESLAVRDPKKWDELMRERRTQRVAA